MKCPKCKSEIKSYENQRYCSKCGYPVNAPIDDKIRNLHTVHFDADLGALFVNGIRHDMVTAFSLVCEDGKCSLTVSGDERFNANLSIR